MTLLTSRCRTGRKYLPGSAKLEALLFYGLEATAAYRHEKQLRKIIGNSTPWYAQGYFVYDSKKLAGSRYRTCTRQRNYSFRLLNCSGGFVGCHQYGLSINIQMAGV